MANNLWSGFKDGKIYLRVERAAELAANPWKREDGCGG